MWTKKNEHYVIDPNIHLMFFCNIGRYYYFWKLLLVLLSVHGLAALSSTGIIFGTLESSIENLSVQLSDVN